MLARPERLRSNRQFQQVFKQGRSVAEGPVVLHFLHTENDPSRHCGFTVSKKVGNAVVRNLVKRRLRAAYAGYLARLPQGVSLVCVARTRAATASYAELDTALGAALTRAGLL